MKRFTGPGDVAGLRDQGEHARFLFVVGDPGIARNVYRISSARQRLVFRAPSSSIAPDGFRRALNLALAFSAGAGPCLSGPPMPEHVKQSHWAPSTHDVLCATSFLYQLLQQRMAASLLPGTR